MASYISVRGWLECEETDIGKLKEIVNVYTQKSKGKNTEQNRRELYQKGWNFPNEIVNWTAYVFYGADIRSIDLDFIRKQIEEMVKVNDEIEGHFFIDDDEGEKKEYWRIVDGNLTENQRQE